MCRLEVVAEISNYFANTIPINLVGCSSWLSAPGLPLGLRETCSKLSIPNIERKLNSADTYTFFSSIHQ